MSSVPPTTVVITGAAPAVEQSQVPAGGTPGITEGLIVELCRTEITALEDRMTNQMNSLAETIRAEFQALGSRTVETATIVAEQVAEQVVEESSQSELQEPASGQVEVIEVATEEPQVMQELRTTSHHRGIFG